MSRYSLDNHGRLPLPAPLVRAFAGKPLQQVSVTDRHLLLGIDDGQGELTLAGALGDISVADLLSFFNMFRKTGILRFRFPGGSRDLYFKSGEIVFATSTFPEEGIGEILCDLGKLDRAVLEKARQAQPGKGGLGRLLVDKGVVGPKDLWLATRQQVEAIVYHLFAAAEGSFAFFARPLAENEIVRLSMSTQNLVMEGLRRIDERALFLRRIGSLDLQVVPAADSAEGGLTPTEERLLRLMASEPGDVRSLVRRSGLGEYTALRLVYQFLERGLIRLEEPVAAEVAGDLGEMLAICNAALVALHRRVVAANPGFGEELRLFLRDLPQPFSYVFREVSLREDGSVDGSRILANLAGLEEGDKLKLLADALNELIFMACMAARRDLKDAEAAALIGRVQQVSDRIKNLVGRKV